MRWEPSGEEMSQIQEGQAYTLGIKDVWPRVRSIWAFKRRRGEDVTRRGSLAVSSEDVEAWRPEIRTLQTKQSVLNHFCCSRL